MNSHLRLPLEDSMHTHFHFCHIEKHYWAFYKFVYVQPSFGKVIRTQPFYIHSAWNKRTKEPHSPVHIEKASWKVLQHQQSRCDVTKPATYTRLWRTGGKLRATESSFTWCWCIMASWASSCPNIWSCGGFKLARLLRNCSSNCRWAAKLG